MASKKILSVGIHLASDDIEYCNFDSDTSFLDWDIILFRPDIADFYGYSDIFQGKASLSDSSSFRLKERSEHWRREINDAIRSGKTVIVYLPELIEIYIDTGKRTTSGTGRGQKTTRHVDLFSNFHCIPVQLAPIATKGSLIKLVDKGAEIISGYWKEFGSLSQYDVILTAEKMPTCLLTKSGSKTVGAIYKDKTSNGTLLLLPNIDFYQDNFYAESGDDYDWTPAANQFAARLIGQFISLDKAFKSAAEVTPEPPWSQVAEYELDAEKNFRSELLKIEGQLEDLQIKKEIVLGQVRQSGMLRNLLFEKSKPLEYAIIEALTILGFTASQYKDSESEFDVVFESAEGRLIGEAEGKDSKAINVDKLRQLSMNLHEDLQRESVDKPAKGVLFGNAFRLMPLVERGAPFTEKCVTAAISASTALVSTPDLFHAARHLANTSDEAYATECRKAIATSNGLVIFPAFSDAEGMEIDVMSDQQIP